MNILNALRHGAAVFAGLAVVAPALAEKLSCSAPSDAADHVAALYGEEIHFDVYRKGDRVGTHRVRFDNGDHGLMATSEVDLRIHLLFVPVFRYSYRSVEVWRDGSLKQLTVTVNDNGEAISIAAVRAAEGLAVRTGQRSYVTPGQVFPTSHWHGAVVSEQRVLNTLTGLVNEVRIEARGREPVETESGMVAAGRYAYSGDLNTDVWYDDCGRWVKLRFQARDGSTIDYVCRRCQGGVAARAGR